jgi:ABC-2 type transport system permease protein
VLRSAWFIARKDLRYMLRQRETLLWTFVMPPVFFFFIGTITAGFGDSGEAREPIALVAPVDAGFLADQLARRLEDRGYQVERLVPGAGPETPTRRLVLPPAFTESVLAGRRVKVALETGEEEGLDSSYDEIRVARAVYAVLADVVVSGEAGEAPTPTSLARLSATPRTLTLEVKQAGRRREIPGGFEQAIPGTMVMFTLLVLLTSGAVLLVIERQQGLLRRLASSPMPRGSIVLGKWGGRMGLGAVQIGFAMLAGTLLFGMSWGPDLPMLVLVLIAWGALAAALGLLLGNLARSEGQAVALGVLASNALAALGGCWWPIEVTPQWMQRLALFLPTGLAMDALHKLVSFEAGPASAVPHVLGMSLAALAVGWLGTRTFRFQ